MEAENSTMFYLLDMSAPDWLTMLYTPIFILGLLGNIVVIFTVWRMKGKRRTTDVYMGNLALADLIFMGCLLLLVMSVRFDHHFSTALCKFGTYMMRLNVYASVFCVTCMSVDRYLAIVRKHLRTYRYMWLSMAATWLLSGLMATPNLLFRTVTNTVTNCTLCVMDFGLDVERKKLWIVGLIMWSVVLGFLLPFLAMTVSYCFIGCTVRRHFDAMRKVDRHKRRTLKIVITLMTVFAVCWMPHHVVRCAISLINLYPVPSSIAFRRFLVLAQPYANSLVCINSCLNPFLYAFLDLRFRSHCLRLLHLKNG